MKREINIKVNDGRIKGTIYDPAKVNAQILAAFGIGEGGGMDGDWTAVTFNTETNTLPIGAIESDKVKWTISNGLTNNVIAFGSGTVGARKSLWVHETSGSFKLFNRELGLDGIFQILTSQPSIDYSGSTYSDHLFECYCIAANQWIFAEVGLPDTITTLPAAVGDLETGKVDKVEGYSLVSDTEIAKIHSQNTDTKLAEGTDDEVSAAEIKVLKDYAHDANKDNYLAFESDNQVSAEELRGVVDFANIATPPTAYQIPFTQDILGVKSLKYSDNFVFEAGTLKVKGAGNTTGKTLSIFNLAETENVTVLDSGNVGIGTSNPSVKFHASDEGASIAAGLLSGTAPTILASGQAKNLSNTVMLASNSATQRPIFNFIRSRGTLSVPLVVANNDQLGDLLFGGYDGGALQSGAGVFVYVDGTVSSGNVPMRISFVTGSNPTNRAERLTIKSTGNVGIGTTSPVMRLDVSQATGQCFRMRHDGSTTYKADFTLNSAGKLTIAAAGNVEFTGDVNLTGVLKIDGVQVLKEQQAAIADIKENYVEDDINDLTELAAALNATAIQLNKILALARTHGLIST